MYHSPLRPDKNASFSVSTRKNLWMDFGTSQGGNVIDLAIALKGYCPFSEAVTWLEEQAKCRAITDRIGVCLRIRAYENPGAKPSASAR